MLLTHLMDLLSIFRPTYIGNAYVVDMLYVMRFTLIVTVVTMLGMSMAKKRMEMRKQYPPFRLNIKGEFRGNSP